MVSYVSSAVSFVSKALPNPLYGILIYPSYIQRKTKDKPDLTDNSFNVAKYMVCGALRIATASLGAYAFYKIGPTDLKKKALFALTAGALSVPSTALAAAGYCFYKAAALATAAWATKSLKSGALATLSLAGGYLLANNHLSFPVNNFKSKIGLLDIHVIGPIGDFCKKPLAQSIDYIKNFGQ